ncbi:MAG: hypothetical protein KME29_04850 [Calothrix sp. FI2-JRJ7]|jgi:hypothetical protein|nr:hypothetical protein [Calothrix sp. FI2-JRJ7]
MEKLADQIKKTLATGDKTPGEIRNSIEGAYYPEIFAEASRLVDAGEIEQRLVSGKIYYKLKRV